MAIDEGKLHALLGKAVVDVGAVIHAGLVLMGDRLGLYRALADGGPSTPAELAQRTGTHERYVREWLNSQAAGGYATYDPAFAAQNLAAARKAWAAAVANPALYATVADGNGGGAYDDTDVADEFYWAAAELYLTTAEKPYLDAVLASPLHSGDVFRAEGFDWKWTGAIGRLELATVPSALPGRAEPGAKVRPTGNKTLPEDRERRLIRYAARQFFQIVSPDDQATRFSVHMAEDGFGGDDIVKSELHELLLFSEHRT